MRFVDCHLHFVLEHLEEFIGSFDELGLSGAWNIAGIQSGEETDFRTLVTESARRGVHTFYWPQWKELTDQAYPQRLVRQIDELARGGIRGLKVWKDMGLGLTDPAGKLMMLDDERLNPVWEKLIERNLILTAHVADPASFWLPLDASNPAYETLKTHPQWHFGKPGLPGRSQLFEARDRLHQRYPDLLIVNSHCGGYAESLRQLGEWMDNMPNFHATIGWKHIAEDDPDIATFFHRHGHRVMFETDLGLRRGRKPDLAWNRDMYAKATGAFTRLLEPLGRHVLENFAHANGEHLMAVRRGV